MKTLIQSGLTILLFFVLLGGCAPSSKFYDLERNESFLRVDEFAKLMHKRAKHGNEFAQQAVKNCKKQSSGTPVPDTLSSIQEKAFNFVFFDRLSDTEKEICLRSQMTYMNTGDFTKYVKSKSRQKEIAVSYQLALKDIAKAYDLEL